MEPSAIVAAFAESPTLRETLSVLLEDECRLRFLHPDAAASPDAGAADLALIAARGPARIAHRLRQHAPTLPVVTVDLPGAARIESTLSAEAVEPHVDRVPLEPHAIRNAVLQRLAADRGAALRGAVRTVAETLRRDLAYSFAALRSFSTLQAASAGPDTYALLGTVMREQMHVVGECTDHIEQFRTRPRSGELSERFSMALCRQLEQPDPRDAARALLCDCVIETLAPPAGPVCLVPMVAHLLRAQLRRRTDSAVVHVRVRTADIALSYPRRQAAPPFTTSWPLLLAAFALQPWSWSVVGESSGIEEVLTLRSAA